MYVGNKGVSSWTTFTRSFLNGGLTDGALPDPESVAP